MSLKVWTARYGCYSGLDAMDITRATAHNVGLVMGREVPGAIFAPSWSIENKRQRELDMAERERSFNRMQRADHITQASWLAFARKYTTEMRLSYQQHKAGWDAVLKRESVTCCCTCSNPVMCHRTLLTDMFGKLGAQVMGERPDQKA